MLAEYLTKDKVAINVDISDPEAAVEKAGQLLVDNGLAEPRYIEAMKDMLAKEGAYIVISPGLAIPHARPEDGVLKEGLSLITLATPIEFGHPGNDPVEVVIGFCAVDDTSHVEMMSGLANFLTKKGEAIKEVSNKEELIELIKDSA